MRAFARETGANQRRKGLFVEKPAFGGSHASFKQTQLATRKGNRGKRGKI